MPGHLLHSEMTTRAFSRRRECRINLRSYNLLPGSLDPAVGLSCFIVATGAVRFCGDLPNVQTGDTLRAMMLGTATAVSDAV